jgi:hypothetical protein
MSADNGYNFSISGEFANIDNNLVPVVDANGNTTSFLLPDGRYAQLVMALEIVSSDNTQFSYVTSEKGMADLGFEGLDYKEMVFVEDVR